MDRAFSPLPLQHSRDPPLSSYVSRSLSLRCSLEAGSPQMRGPGYRNLGGEIGCSPSCGRLFIKMEGWGCGGDGGRGAEYAAGGNERPRQLPKRVTNHPPCPNPPWGDLMDQWSQCVAVKMHGFDKSNMWAHLGFKEKKKTADYTLSDAVMLHTVASNKNRYIFVLHY